MFLKKLLPLAILPTMLLMGTSVAHAAGNQASNAAAQQSLIAAQQRAQAAIQRQQLQQALRNFGKGGGHNSKNQ